MRARFIHHAVGATLVVVHHEVLTEQTHGLGVAPGKILRERQRVPVETHDVTHGSARSDVGEQFVFFNTQHDQFAPSGRYQLGV